MIARAALCSLVLAACGGDEPAPPPLEPATLDAGRDTDGEISAATPPDYGPTCFGFDPGVVHLRGEEEEDYASGLAANFTFLAPALSATDRCYNFETGEDAKVRPDGRLIYIASWWIRPQRALHLLVPDEYDAASGRRTRHTDQVLPTPACGANTEGVARFVLDPRSGEPYYRCLLLNDDEHDFNFYDMRGEVFYEGELRAIAMDGTLLIDAYRVFELRRRPDAVPVQVALPEDITGSIAATRVTPEGFWLAYTREADEVGPAAGELVLIRVSGKVELLGRYPDPPPDLHGPDHAALDAEGNLYELRWSSRQAGSDVVLLRPLGGSASEIVFDEAAEPDAGLPLVIGEHSGFVTGP